jgi:hypothetical protein
MSDLSRRWGRRRSSALAVVVLTMLVVVAPVRAAVAYELGGGDPAATARATQDGWWNRIQGPQEGEPEGNPLRPLIPALPAPPTVPGDATAVAVAAGQPVLLAAVGIEMTLPAGGLVESLKLILTEAASGNINSTGAKVVACPATIPWGPAKNGAWRDRPESDCSLFQVEGVRADDGTWTFDLTGLATLWTDPFAPLAQNGVVLGLDAATSPAPMQVAWGDFDSGKVAVELVATVLPGGTGSGFDASFPAPSAAESGAPFTEVPYAAPEYLPVAATTTFSDPLAFPTGQPTFATYEPVVTDIPAPETTTQLVAAPQPAGPAPGGTLQAQPVVGFWEDIPAPTVLLVPVAFGLALLVGLILGPGGRPLPYWPRAGGLTRALARRRPGGGGAVV